MRVWRNPMAGVVTAGVLLLVAALVVTVEARHTPAGTGSTTVSRQPVVLAPVVAARVVPDLGSLPDATTYATTAAAPADLNQDMPPSGIVVHPRDRVPIFTEPGGPAFAALPVHEVSSDTWVPVIAREPGWVQILLPSRPNGSTGWLSTQDNSLATATTPFRIEVDRATFRLRLYRDGRDTHTWTIGVGKTSAPTPTGRTFVVASIQDSHQTYSPVILPLGIHSTSHDTFGGGPGTTGIHTWPSASVFGTQSSDGCIRVPPDALHVLAATVPLGTPVLIR